MLKIAVVLIFGIYLGERVGGSGAVVMSFAISVFWLILAAITPSCKQKNIGKSGMELFCSLCILCSVFFLGFFLVSANRESTKSRLAALRQSSVVTEFDSRDLEGVSAYDAIIVTPPAERGKVMKFDMMITSEEVHPFLVHASLLRDTITNNYLALGLGDGIRACSALNLERRQSAPTTFIMPRHWKFVSPQHSRLSSLQRTRLNLMMFREGLLERWKLTNADAESEAIVSAMALGDKGSLSRQLKDEYSISGASHVLALSGLHLGIIYFLLSFVFIRLRWQTLGQVVVLPLIWLFALMVGFSPSVVRAATMLSVYALIMMLRRPAFSLNTLSLAAVVMLLANPFNLWDIGFQLSFMAVLGILLFYQPIVHFLSVLFARSSSDSFVVRLFIQEEFNDSKPTNTILSTLKKWVISMIAVSCSAQLLTAPLVAFYFGRFSTYFLLTNLVAVPFVTLILYCALAFFLLSFLPSIQIVVGNVVAWFAKILNGLIFSVSSLPFSSVDGIQLSVSQVVLIYLMLALFSFLTCRLLKKLRHRVFYRS